MCKGNYVFHLKVAEVLPDETMCSHFTQKQIRIVKNITSIAIMTFKVIYFVTYFLCRLVE